MAKVNITVCDECMSPDKATRRYRITSDGRMANIDLCKDHGKALELVLEKHGGSSVKRRKFEASVKTMEQIEAEKRAARART